MTSASVAAATPSPAPATRPLAPRRRVGGGSSRLGLAAVAVIVAALTDWRTGDFVTTSNLTAIMVNTSAILLAAIAVARLVIAGAVDLSLGGMYALIAVTAAMTARDTGSAVLAVALGLLLGALLGAVNGVLVRLLQLSPIIVTLALGGIYRGVAMVITDARSVTGLPGRFVALGRARLAGVPVPVVVALAAFAAGGLALTRTVGGIRSYAVGGSVAAAGLSGVDTDRHRWLLFMYVGATMGAVGVLGTSRLGSGPPTIGTQFEIDVLTAVILGGVAFSGGRGRPLGVFIGVVTIGIVNSSMIFLGLSGFHQQIAKGAILLLALAADAVWRFRRQRPGKRTAGEPSAGEVARPAVAADVPGPVAPGPTGRRDNTAPVVLSARSLAKSYGPVAAVGEVSLDVRAGEVLCLVGDNGAGKSTVIKMLSGVEQPDAGCLILNGRPVEFHNRSQARNAGIEVVYQDLALCPNLGAAYNLALGHEPRRFELGALSPFDRRRAGADAEQRLRRLGAELDDQWRPVAELSGGQRQAVAISRVVGEGAKVAILDEPTAALGVAQTASVLQLVRALAAEGSGVVMITHDVRSVLDVSDRVVVLSRGRVIFEGATSALTDRELVQLMAGLRLDSSSASLAATVAGGVRPAR